MTFLISFKLHEPTLQVHTTASFASFHTTVCEGQRQRKIKLNPDFYMASSQIIDIRVATKLHEL